MSVKSMCQSWHNFFFAALDPEGFISIDKPPVGYWLQCISVWIFGFNGFALVIPQALSASASVVVLYFVIGSRLGQAAGLWASAALSITPIFVAVVRNNTVDATLIAVMLIAAHYLLRATETQRLRDLLLAFGLIAVGFNIKMLAAYLVLPAFYLVFLRFSPLKWSSRIAHAAAATLLMFSLSSTWILAVEWTSPDKRPYVGGTKTNSALELTAKYNGIARLLPSDMLANVTKSRIDEDKIEKGTNVTRFFEFDLGKAGPFRLLNYQMASQISWLLPIILVGLIVASINRKYLTQAQLSAIALFLSWAIPSIVLFSFAALMHRYYLSLLAVPFAALFGIAIDQLRTQVEKSNRQWIFIPICLAVSTAFHAYLIQREHYSLRWLAILVGLCGALVVTGLVVTGNKKKTSFRTVLICGFLLNIVSPFLWSLSIAYYGGHAVMPFAGVNLKQNLNEPYTREQAELRRNLRKFRNFQMPPLEQYLAGHYAQERFMAAVPCGLMSAPLMIYTGLPVLTMGGFHGRDPALSLDQMKALVASGQLRYAALSPHFKLSSRISEWIEKHGKEVPQNQWNRPEAWKSASAKKRDFTKADAYIARTLTLYDLTQRQR